VTLEAHLLESPYDFPRTSDASEVLAGLNRLGAHHYALCPGYRRIVDAMWGGEPALQVDRLEAVPYLPVSLFKRRWLSSVPDSDVTVTLTSSGTTGQQVSRIAVDAETSRRQQLALIRSMAHVLGKDRLPMLIADTASVIRDPALLSARGAGILGMMRLGRQPVFMLDRDQRLDVRAIHAFLERYGHERFFVFGFTFIVWELLRQAGDTLPLDLTRAVLVHSGGWKSMQDRAVDNTVFRATLRERFGLHAVHNFYGMVEQIGTLFMEGDDGLLYPPSFANVVIRDPHSWAVCEPGQPGLVQVQSLVPLSYPGHSLLTEDMGVIERFSDEGRFRGPGFRVLGRVPKVELRGCSDVMAA